ncbi:preprotein translocase subunit SecE [Desulfovibrio litoralis]|uniref:Protein translocase subunit SecE n=1 Tax=Desulfovibrio litoralis DSM 11393 TaxID=1121455 RepID=A0A1M7TMD3_9BACT|nr:preprotein translocase subunit SecE [Desulfovibrio litoralis]SHN71892.1 preprotein translocase subunit SecE [Desulfovibrio litoralis DSM 11393]
MAATKDKDKSHNNSSKTEKSWFESAGEFYRGSVSEIKKVTWPTKPEIKVTTFAVLGFVLFMTVYLGIVDFGLFNLINWIISSLS